MAERWRYAQMTERIREALLSSGEAALPAWDILLLHTVGIVSVIDLFSKIDKPVDQVRKGNDPRKRAILSIV
jgi:hypothetical protein